MNFCADLRSLLSGDNISEYSSILAARISAVGTILLDEVSPYAHVQHSVSNAKLQDFQKAALRCRRKFSCGEFGIIVPHSQKLT
jgi:hypothetical protein